MAKRIKIEKIRTKNGDYKNPSSVTAKKNFASYAAVARYLKDGDTVLVVVRTKFGNIWGLEGYGEVSRDGDSYTCPRRLMHDY